MYPSSIKPLELLLLGVACSQYCSVCHLHGRPVLVAAGELRVGACYCRADGELIVLIVRRVGCLRGALGPLVTTCSIPDCFARVMNVLVPRK